MQYGTPYCTECEEIGNSNLSVRARDAILTNSWVIHGSISKWQGKMEVDMSNGRGLIGKEDRVIETERFKGGPLLELNACMFGGNRQNENSGCSLIEMISILCTIYVSGGKRICGSIH